MQSIADFPSRILHADDDPLIQDVVERALKGLRGCEIESVLSGAEFIDKARDFQPDLILLDLKMPGIDGVEIMREIRNMEHPIDAPVIFLTGHIELVMKDEYKNLGVIGILHKPISAGIIPERIRYMWCEHHGLPTNIEPSGFL